MLKPRPRRPFDLSSAPPTPPSDLREMPALQTPINMAPEGASTPARNRSIMNLTSSTLYGIYQPTGYATDGDGQATPWGTGAETPIDSRPGSFDFSRSTIPDMVTQDGPNGLRRRRKSTVTRARPRKSFKGYYLPILGRDLALLSLGTLYGMLITRLHDHGEIVPVKVEAVDRSHWLYLAFWAVVAVLVGEAMPWVDTFWAPLEEDEAEDAQGSSPQRRNRSMMDSWNDVVRPIGVFVGIAFAVRKLPWQSTLQLSLTLAMTNPAIWYLVDRSPPGLIFSTFVALTGTAILLAVNPGMIPSPSSVNALQNHLGRGTLNNTANGNGSEDMVLGILSHESIGVGVWIASVLFVSAVCFGNVGRRLAPRA